MAAIGARWLKRLAVPGARVLPDRTRGYAVFPKGDRRRRPVAHVTPDQFHFARAQGWLEPEGEGYRLSAGFDRAGVRFAHGRDGFMAQHGGFETAGIVDRGGRIETVRRRAEASPLDRWRRAGPDGAAPLLDRAEYEAGERLRADHVRSTMSQRLTADSTSPPRSKSGRGPSAPEDAPLSALDARTRVMDALEAVGPGLDRVVFAVCIREAGLGDVERGEGWPKRSGKIALKLGLTRLAIHYGMKPRQAAPASP
ncbi:MULTISPECIES: DUF6456 domain-containing protein [Hyphobacterium]|uniref:DUF6456 domain-containing protein n=1 Tax=Hyphobacterium vulgare TaxID=1736751 RepID=A0ABV6ZUY9_9PROT